MRRVIANSMLSLLVLLLGLAGAGVVRAETGSAGTVYVSITGSDTTGDGSQAKPYRTIQKGINAAINGDTVSVAAGTYAELVSISKRVYLVGVGTPTIDPPSDGDAVTFSGNGADGASISGFRITGATGSSYNGIGVKCTDYADPVIKNNIIAGNAWNGIWVINYSAPTISGNIITGNTIDGILFQDNDSLPNVTNNIITFNGGAGITFWGHGPSGRPTTAIVTNNTIADNSARGIYLWGDRSRPTITNNIITMNRSAGIYCTNYSSPTMSYNDIWGNWWTNYYGCSPGTGDISADPQFVSGWGGGYHLRSTSPCLDKGTNAAVGLPTRDKDGNPRVMDGNNDGAATVDMGAYELDTIPPVTTATPIGTSGLNGWYVSDVQVALTASDEGGSGVAATEYRFEPAPILSDWRYRELIKITGSTTGVLTDYQVPVTVDTAFLVAAGKMQASGADIRFRNSLGVELPYWIELGMNTVSTRIWVKVDSIPAKPDATTIYMYYGNPSAGPVSNGDNTFVFFDDFNNLSKWTGQTGAYSVSGSELKWSAQYAGSNVVFTSSFSWNYGMLEVRARTTVAGGSQSGQMYIHAHGSAVAVNDCATGDRIALRFDTRDVLVDEVGVLGRYNYDTNYHTYGAGWFGTNSFKFFIDGVEGYSGTHTPDTGRLKFNDEWTKTDKYVDWIRIRKYASPEPAVNVGNWNSYTAPFTVSTEGTTTVYYRSTDNAGNVESTRTQVVKIDKTLPTISGVATTSPDANGWYRTDVVVHFTASDNVSGIQMVTPDTTLTSEGVNQAVTGTATDMAGNTATVIVSNINIDKTPPSITGIRTPANANGWNSGNVTVHFTAADNISGIASVTPDIVVSTEGQNQSVAGTATDVAGNSASTTVSNINIDRTKPIITINSPQAQNYLTSENLTLAFFASDASSGVEIVTALLDGEPVISGQVINLAGTAGDHILRVSATDKAGNTDNRTVSFSVVIAATVDIDPNTLNLKSQSDKNAITAYIEFPTGYDVGQIDVATVVLTTNKGTVAAQLKPTEVGDYDNDGVPDRMVKFDRQAVIAIVDVGDKVKITISGRISGAIFEGSDEIRAIESGKK